MEQLEKTHSDFHDVADQLEKSFMISWQMSSIHSASIVSSVGFKKEVKALCQNGGVLKHVIGFGGNPDVFEHPISRQAIQ